MVPVHCTSMLAPVEDADYCENGTVEMRWMVVACKGAHPSRAGTGGSPTGGPLRTIGRLEGSKYPDKRVWGPT